MKMSRLMLAAALVALPALSQDAENPFYARASLVNVQGDWRVYNGGQTRGHGFEVGYTFAGSESEFLTYAVWAGFVKSVGEYRADQDVTLALEAWRAGTDAVFSTPSKNLKVYAGLNVNYWNGNRNTASRIYGYPGMVSPATAKFGLRVGAEYRLTPNWGVALDYNASEWRSDSIANASPVRGINPVNPSWFGLSVQYRWDVK